MVYDIMVQWCVIGDGLYDHGTVVCYWCWFILSWYCAVLLVFVYVIMILSCVIGVGFHYHGTVVCYWCWFIENLTGLQSKSGL